MGNNELCVPAAAVAASDENGGAVPPGVGDEVEFTVRGNVTRAEGDKVYVTPTSANGEPIAAMGGHEGMEGESDEAMMDRDVAGYRAQAMIAVILAAFCWFALAGGVQAQQVKEANRKDKSVIATNNWVATTEASQVFSVSVYNSGSSTVYLMVFDSATNQLVNARPALSAIRVPANETWGWDWAANGIPFDYGVNVAISTTPLTLTNAAAVGDMVVTRRVPK